VHLTSDLPPGLQPWAPSLGFLTVEAALHIGPLVRRLDALVRRHDAHQSAAGEPDGYGDLSRRGHPDQMLLSEWLLADEAPLEFMRRAAARELLHIARATRSPQPRGDVAVLADTGPDQLGAPRLVQLAALVVLHRRALARGSELMLGLTSEPVDRWHRGELPEQFEHWRTAHDTLVPGREHVDARGRQLDDEDELWILAGEGLADACRDRDLLVTTRDAAWSAEGTATVELAFEGRRTTLVVPPGPVSVQTLRGRMLRRRETAAPRPAAGPIGCPSFPSADRRLLLRGETSHELLVTPIPTQASGGAGRPRTHKFGGVVIAASSLGGRLVALVRGGDELRCVVVGKRLKRVEEIAVALDDFDALLPDDGHLVSELAPLFYDRGDLLCRIGRDWWRLAIDRAPRRAHDVIAVAPGPQMDLPRIAALDGHRLFVGSAVPPIANDVIPDALRVVAGGYATAWSIDERWHVRGPRVRPVDIAIDEACHVIGMAVAGRADDPALISVSDAGALVRLHSKTATKTLTRWSGVADAHAVHPTIPLIAVQRDDGSVEIGDLESGDLLTTVSAT
jgi:hypothetical protein